MALRSTLAPPLPGARQKMTDEEFWAWIPDGLFAEWVDGEGAIYRSNTDLHTVVVVFLANMLSVFARAAGIGRVFVGPYPIRPSPDSSIRQPDVFFVPNEQLDRVTQTLFDGVPGLIVEAISDDSVTRDRRDKYREYEGIGVRDYLLVDTRAVPVGVELFSLNAEGRYAEVPADDDGRLHVASMPGLWLLPEWLAAEPLPDPEDVMLDVAPDLYLSWLQEKRRTRGL